MAAVDQLNALTTKVAEKLNALNTNIGGLAAKGVSTDGGNLLENGSDERPYFDGSSLTIGISSDANNDLTLGSDDKPYLSGSLYVPQLRTLTAGQGINTIGDLSADRTISLDYNYLDNRYNQAYKQRGAARVATESNVALSGLQTIDGITLVAGDRVLLLGQTNPAQNGVYVAASGAWTRATDFDEPILSEVAQGAAVFVQEGVNLGGTGWTLRSEPPYVIGTTPLEFDQYAGTTSYVSGDLINIDGNQINHDTGSWTSKSNLSGATVISNLSVDAYGHPTNWTTRNLTAGNIGAEPAFSKNTAFNKNFGTSTGTVLEGDWRPSWSQITGTNPSYTKSESDSNYILKNARTDGGYAWIRTTAEVENGGAPLYITNHGSGDLLRLFQGAGDGSVKASIKNDGSYVTANGTVTAAGGNSSQWNTAYGWGNHASAGYVPNTITISTGSGLSGGGNLTANRTLSIDPAYAGFTNYYNKTEAANTFVNVTGDTMTGDLVIGAAIRSSNRQMVAESGSELFLGDYGGGTSTVSLRGSSDPIFYNGSNNTIYHTGNLTLSTLGGEPAFSKNTAFNKNFGTSTGTVLEGDWRPSWSQITGKPTTLSGYGITDAYTKSVSDGRYLLNTTDVLTGDFTASSSITSSLYNFAGRGAVLTPSGISDILIGDYGGGTAKISLRGSVSPTFYNGVENTIWHSGNQSSINAGRVDGFHFWSGTQAQYDAIGTKDGNTFYAITA